MVILPGDPVEVAISTCDVCNRSGTGIAWRTHKAHLIVVCYPCFARGLRVASAERLAKAREPR